jgi:hypothetical protein
MRRWLWLVVPLLAALYVAYPYVTIERIQAAIDARDPVALDVYVDWPAVRAGVKADIEEQLGQELAKRQGEAGQDIGGTMGTALANLLIPAVIDKLVDVLVSSKSAFTYADLVDPGHDRKPRLWDYITYAFFSSPTDFRIDFADPADPQHRSASALMSFAGGKWRVTRLHLPLTPERLAPKAQD